MSLPQVLEEALFDSLSTGTFVDVKFYAFSQRTATGRIQCPKPLYASSRVLQTVPYFRSLLSDGFSEGKLKDLRSPFPSDKPTVLDDRDILDDGDLENAEEDVKFNVSPQTSQLGSTGDLPSIYTLRPSNPGAHLGKVVVLCDIPFATLRAILFFLYTEGISFTSPIPVVRGAYRTTGTSGSSVSAKSVYLAADKYDIPELKSLALKWIGSTIHSCDIIRELASDFTAMFPEIRKICLQQLANALCAGDRESVTGNLMSAIRGSIHGNPEFSIDPETRGAIFDILTSGYTLTPRLPYIVPVQTRPANWSYLREALWKSLMSGEFLDGQIKAYRDKYKDKKLKSPSSIYFSTASIPPDTMNKIRHESMACSLPEQEYDSDSDLEVDNCELVHRRADRHIPPIAFMKFGSWKTWRATLFFVYSHKVAFTPIRSQGVVRSDSPESTPIGSCSPKSVFVLAEKIAVQRLQDLAKEDLLKKVTKDNLMIEYFSKFVNSHPSLLHTINEVVWKTRNAEIDAIVRRTLVESTGGNPHVSPALELFLQTMIAENNKQIIGHCPNCGRGHTVLEQPKGGRCQFCRKRVW